MPPTYALSAVERCGSHSWSFPRMRSHTSPINAFTPSFKPKCHVRAKSLTRVRSLSADGQQRTEATVYFRFADTVANAQPGENLLQVAVRAGVNIPSSCCSGSCGSCEVEVTKASADGAKSSAVVRACVVGIPPGYSRLDIDLVEDPIWGTDGWNT